MFMWVVTTKTIEIKFNDFWKSIQILPELSIFDNAKFEGLVWRVAAACCHLVPEDLARMQVTLL